ncbi:MAG: 2-oxoacid:acceptor oxidoreductase family protein [Candidatus Margulisiibacteriota bacterium]|jgi:pyruvate-ferredoxin/flavodoxin oxidoreductase
MSKINEPKYKGEKVTTNGNQLVALHVEARLADAGIFYPITPSTEQGENFEFSFAKGELNVFGNAKIAIETEGEHSAQGGAIAYSVTGKRVVNFTSGQGLLYGLEQYFHAPGKMSSMVLEVSARALTKSALNVHCGHDDIYAALDTGWTILFGKDAQQAADQALILRKVAELTLTPGINAQDGFLTSHLERSFLRPEADLIREFLGRAEDIIDTPTEAQRELFGPTRRRVPELYSTKNPILLGPVQNQEHYMNGIAARRHTVYESILGFLEAAYEEFGNLTGRKYGLLSEYNTKDADTVFVALGCAAENIEAAIDYIKKKDNINIGIIHINVIRPFPEKAIINALKGKKNVIILERSDSQASGDNPLARDIKSALYKAIENSKTNAHDNLPSMTLEEMPQIFDAVYGLGSRDFRPEDILGAYEYVVKGKKRQDGFTVKDGKTFFYLGINHPYNVVSEDKPSLLPEKAIAIRFHSIGGWGAITTGKNLSEILGDMGTYIKERDFAGSDKEVLHISANPKYGSEKKGAPTNYFLVVAPERVRVNCDLKHVDVVLCCDPKAFTHTNPIEGLKEGGAFIWESAESDSAKAWEKIPKNKREEIIKRKIRLYTLNGFAIAAKATPNPELQLRMQGNSFLGAFFKVSSFLPDNNIPVSDFEKVVEKQYKKKFGKLGEAVIQSNMKVMQDGFSEIIEIPYGDINAPDRSLFTGEKVLPCVEKCTNSDYYEGLAPVFKKELFEKEFKAGLGYFQPASAYASTGIMPIATGDQSSKFVARRIIPAYNPKKCTGCLECVTICPDTALPNTAQDISTILEKVVANYVTDAKSKPVLFELIKKAEPEIRSTMLEEVAKKSDDTKLFSEIALEKLTALASDDLKPSLAQIKNILEKLPLSFAKTLQTFAGLEKKIPGQGGLFGIFVADLCKGCGQCVKACGNRGALTMVKETEDHNAEIHSGTAFLNLLADTDQKYLGIFNAEHPEESKAAALRYHLMQQSKYKALVSGDGACAGCGEKSILHNVITMTESYMRPIFHRKADRLLDKAKTLKEQGVQKLNQLEKSHPESYEFFKRTILHSLFKLGGENITDSLKRIAGFTGNNQDLVNAIIMILEQDAFNHKDMQVVEGKLGNGMCVMGMTASTGCNSVYGSTPPANPHSYPWMNSLFQDGATIGWLTAESFMQTNARKSIMPERLANYLLSDFQKPFTENEYYKFIHFNERHMTDLEIQELPKVWAVGGDGAFGDIGFQNVSKAILQNRPNLKVLLLDTLVYSNTGGQNSDISVMCGGIDMNQFGLATQGKLTEKKEVAQILTVGHGSPFVAQVSMASSINFFKAILDSLTYRGTAFIQSYTSCMPEHGIGDDIAFVQAGKVRDSRGVPELVFNPMLSDSYSECLNIRSNPSVDRDWHVKTASDGTKFDFMLPQWAVSESRFRSHLKKAPEGFEKNSVDLKDVLWRVTQQDVVYRRVFDPDHRSYVPKFETYTFVEGADGNLKPMIISRQLVLFCVERRHNWRRLQSLAGIENIDYKTQKVLLERFEKGEISKEDFFGKTNELAEKIKVELFDQKKENLNRNLASQLV